MVLMSEVSGLNEVDGIKEYDGVRVSIGPSCHEPGCRGYGSLSSRIVFVGIAPGRDEVKTGRPLTGPSGRLLTNILAGLGLNRKQVYCTNLICWWKDDPSREEAERCSERLHKELVLAKPKLIVLLGGIVTEIFTNYKFGKIRGAVQWNTDYNCYVMATFHPSAILRGMNEYGSTKDDKASAMIYDFVRDLRKIERVLTWKPGAPDAQVTYDVIDDHEMAQQILYNLPTDELIAIDVETRYDKDDEDKESNIEVLTDKLLCVGVGTSSKAYVFTPKALSNHLDWPDLQWTMHNAVFDSQIMKSELGVWLKVHEDTMLQSYSLDERQGVHRLKTLAREYLGAGFWEDDRGKGKKRLDEIPPEQLYNYNAHDVVYTARLCKLFKQWQIEDNVRDMYERILIRAVNMYKEVSYHGVHINPILHRQFSIDWTQKWLDDEEELQWLAHEAGWPEDDLLNLNSPQQLSTFMYKILSLPITKYTKAGQPSTDKETLESLKGMDPFINKLIDFRRLTKMINIYIFKLGKNIKDDGRAHPKVKLHSSRTGRPALVDPEVQTIPVPYAEEKTGMDVEYTKLRQLFDKTPTDPDDPDPYVFIESDFGKAEIWMAYTYSKDPQMYADLTSGDYHTNTAMDVMEKPREKVTGQDRVDMKRVTFGIMYDREAPSLSKAINRGIDEAQRYINRFFVRNKKYAEWFEQTKKDIVANGELVTKTGRKRRIIILGSVIRALKQAVNYPIQSTANDVLLDAAADIHEDFKREQLDAHILFTVHDSILTECRRSQLNRVCEIIHGYMTARRFEGVVPIPVEIKIGDSWGSCKEFHDCAKGVYDAEHNPKGNKWGGGFCLWAPPQT